MSAAELAENMCMSPAVARRAVFAAVCAVLAVTSVAAFGGGRAVVPGGYYRGSLPAGGSIVFSVADNSRRIQRGLEMTGVRAPCGGGVYVTLFNLVIDRAITISAKSFEISRRTGGTTTKIKGRFSRGGV